MQSAAAVTLGNTAVEVHFHRQGEDVSRSVTDFIYESQRSYRRDRCAVFGELEVVKLLVKNGLDADYLYADTNYQWSGIQRRAQKPWKRIIAGDYAEWFLWYMKWQRFRAFHTIVLLNPIQYLLECESRGYIDGLLARLVSKPLNKMIIFEDERFKQVVQGWIEQRRIVDIDLKSGFGEQELWQAVLAILYGTRLTGTRLQLALERTIWAATRGDTQLVPNAASRLRAFIERSVHDGCYRLSETGVKFVQGLEKVVTKREVEGEEEIEQLFKQTRRRKALSLPESWLEGQISTIVKQREWVTVPMLAQLAWERLEELRQSEDYGLREVLEEFEYDTLDEAQRRLSPSRPTIRRILEKLAQKGQLERHLWSREIGRASIVYCLPGRLPFKADNQCGQCAFYNSLRHRCRLWWLLDKTFHSSNPRWAKAGEYPLSLFEIHKMKNSWRIGPHSSACLRFLDKKRDYKRKSFPEYCDICDQAILGGKMSEDFYRCTNCGTRYFRMRTDVKVLTSYEHEFRKRYQEIAGREPEPDLKKFAEDQAESVYRIVEAAEYRSHRTEFGPSENPHSRTVVLFPGDKMLVRDGKLFLMKRRKVEAIPASGTVIVDHLKIDSEQRAELEKQGATIKDLTKTDTIPSRGASPKFDPAPSIEKILRENQEFVRGLALAMGNSAIIGTRRIVALANLRGSEIEMLQSAQIRFLRRLSQVLPAKFLVYEALIMKQYWRCFDLALRGVLARFGPRKKSRFVRDYVTNPAGRARGYSAVDAAINYMHQRRLYKARLVNMKLGLEWNPGEGFLHRKTKNPKGFGLILDLIDPFKFADREKLLDAMLKYELNWRDFYIATDRLGAKFYYPQPHAIDIMELIGTDSDNLPVNYGGKPMALREAYESTTSKLIQALDSNDPNSYVPFVFGKE